MVARLTPDQKAACSNHVGVKLHFWNLYFDINIHLHFPGLQNSNSQDLQRCSRQSRLSTRPHQSVPQGCSRPVSWTRTRSCSNTQDLDSSTLYQGLVSPKKIFENESSGRDNPKELSGVFLQKEVSENEEWVFEVASCDQVEDFVASIQTFTWTHHPVTGNGNENRVPILGTYMMAKFNEADSVLSLSWWCIIGPLAQLVRASC